MNSLSVKQLETVKLDYLQEQSPREDNQKVPHLSWNPVFHYWFTTAKA
jgi:hypothetical protein